MVAEVIIFRLPRRQYTDTIIRSQITLEWARVILDWTRMVFISLQKWKFSKIIPIHKKGSKQAIENYRPISNLCSSTKTFENLILNRIKAIESLQKINITGKQQNGFKPNHSTATAGLLLQSLIARALVLILNC